MTTRMPSSRSFRAPVILLAVLSACSESFATQSVGRAHLTAGVSTSTSNGVGRRSAATHGNIKLGLGFPAQRSLGAAFRVGRGGDDGSVHVGGEDVSSINAMENESSTSSTATSTALAMAPGGDMEDPSASTDVSTDSKLGPNAPPPGPIRRLLPWFPWHRLPDWLTYARCLAIPLLVVLYYLPSVPNRNIINSVLFAGASFTDWLDGYLARRWDITSNFGAFLDPVADKLMVSTALILLSGTWGATVAIPSAIILAREIAVSALREWMAQRGLRDSVKVGYQGKVKTAATMVALTILLLVPDGVDSAFDALFTPAMVMLYLSAVVTVTSGSVYFKAAAPVLMEKE